VIQRFQDLPLARKVLLIPLLTLLLLGLILGVAVNDAASNTATLKRLDRDTFAPLHRGLVLKDRMSLIHGRLFALLSKKVTENDPVGWNNEAASIVEILGQQSVTLTDLTDDLHGNVPDARLDALIKAQEAYLAAALNTIDIASGNANYGAMMMIGADGIFSQLGVDFDRVLNELSDRMASRTGDAIEHAAVAEAVMIGLGAVAAIITLVGSVTVGRGIARPIALLTAIIKRLAEGDTDVSPPSTGRLDEVGEIARAVEVFRIDAIAKQAADTALSHAHWQLGLALNNMSQGLCLFDDLGRVQLYNQRVFEVTGIPADRIWIGMPYRDLLAAAADAGLLPPDVVDRTGELLAGARAGGMASRLETGMPNGRSVMICRQPLPEGGWVATYEDTTEIRRTEQHIVYLARHDPLTSLPNRRLFQERLDQALARVDRGERFAVLCLDLDHFKRVNDTLGHDVGDTLLRAVAERLQACVREVDTVARLGGDEFAILQENVTDPDSATLLAARIVEVLRDIHEVDGHQVATGTSIGIAMAPDTGTSAGALLKNADVALYFAKAERGRFNFFEPGMAERLQLRQLMEMDLRLAIERQEFELHYQPMIGLGSGRVTGLEALIRWRHPGRGLIQASEFIPVAEESGLIVPLGAWILATACREAVDWPDDIRVAVNLSSIQFKGDQPYRMVAHELDQSGLPAHRLELEITETVLMKDNEQTIAMLHRVHDLGVGISMDDFGTGYSSLSYLHKFPFDKIKIDRSFVADIAHRRGGVEIIRAITALGRGLGMTTVAEGVETDEQLRRLRLEGCGEVQGFLFSRPVPGPEVPEMVARMNGLAAVPAMLARINGLVEAAA
jgi:diguanylate cyclase (GGDEF)-like protein